MAKNIFLVLNLQLQVATILQAVQLTGFLGASEMGPIFLNRRSMYYYVVILFTVT